MSAKERVFPPLPREVSYGILVPLVHRLRANRTMHVELTPVGAPSRYYE